MSFSTNNQTKHDKDMFRCYEVKGVLYVPTYNEAGIYIGPCGKKYLESDLTMAGGRVRMESLYVTSARRESK
jgi:hypothetical protein